MQKEREKGRREIIQEEFAKEASIID